MEKYGFVYIWYDRKRKMYYIGSHIGQIDDGYICSSKRMRDAYRRRPHDFRRRILSEFWCVTRVELLKEEDKWLKFAEKRKNRYYNLIFHSFSTSDQIEKIRKEKISKATKGKSYEERYGPDKAKEVKEKLSKSLKGKPVPEHHKKMMSELRKGKTYKEIYGKENSEKIFRKIRGRTYEEIYGIEKAIALKNQKSDRMTGENHPMYGKSPSEEHRTKIGDANRGRPSWNKGMKGGSAGENNYAHGKSWYNNGIECRRFFVEDVPCGWNKGILRKKRKLNED